MRNVAVLGGGSWGTALAVHLARIGHTVRLWARDPALVAEMRTRRANPVYLPDATVPRDADGHRPARRGAGRRGHGGRRRAVARPARGARQAAAHVDAGAVVAQRHQGARGRLAAADVGGAGRGVAARARSWRCCRARASPPSSPARCRPWSWSRRAATTPSRRVQEDFRSGAMRLYASQRRRRRRARRRLEERDGDRRRRRSRACGLATTPGPRSSPAGWPRCRGWRSPPAATARRSPGWPAWAIWSSPAPAR